MYMDIRKMADALHRLVKCPDLDVLEDFEEETIQALADAQDVLNAYWEQKKS